MEEMLKCQKNDFDQQRVCEAPICYSKYTTYEFSGAADIKSQVSYVILEISPSLSLFLSLSLTALCLRAYLFVLLTFSSSDRQP